MNKLLTLLALLAATLGAPAQTAVTGSSVVPLADDALYRAFGGQTGLDRLMDDFVKRLHGDARIGHFFKESNLDELKKQLASQLCVVAGGPCRYEGASMADAHAEMEVRKADFNALVELLQQAMDAQGIPFAVQNRMLAQLAPMHRDVINTR